MNLGISFPVGRSAGQIKIHKQNVCIVIHNAVAAFYWGQIPLEVSMLQLHRQIRQRCSKDVWICAEDGRIEAVRDHLTLKNDNDSFIAGYRLVVGTLSRIIVPEWRYVPSHRNLRSFSFHNLTDNLMCFSPLGMHSGNFLCRKQELV